MMIKNTVRDRQCGFAQRGVSGERDDSQTEGQTELWRSAVLKKEAFRWGGLFYYFILHSFLLLVPSPTCLLQEAVMSVFTLWRWVVRGKKGGRGWQGLCVCWCVYVWVREEGLFISNPFFLFPPRSDSHNDTQQHKFVLRPPPVSLLLSLSPCLCSVSFNEMNFSSLHASV